MKYRQKNISGFTLVELIVSITIFAMIITAVVSIFLFSSQMSKRVELSRSMQENIKNVVEDIAEGVRISGVDGVVEITQTNTSCTASSSGASIEGFKLCMSSGAEYALGYYDDITDSWGIVSNYSDCELPTTSNPDRRNCRILKKDSIFEDYYPLTNSFIAFEHVGFIITNTDVPKLSLTLELRPPTDKGIRRDVIEANRILIQTTLSERLIKTQ